MPDIERRHFATSAEIRAAGDDDAPQLAGTAAVFGKWSQDLGGFREKIDPGAFKDALKKSDVRALFNHNPDYPLGRLSAKTLRINETKDALEYEVDLPDTQIARDVRTNVKAGNITGNSFSFIVEQDTWKEPSKPGELAERTITKFAEVLDVGPVTFPAYEQTQVSARSLDKAKEVRRHWQDDADNARHEALGLAIREGIA